MKKIKSRDSLIFTARAILARAERGDGDAERANACDQLRKFMERHGLTDEDVNVGHVRKHVFTIPINQQWLFVQVVHSIMGIVSVNPLAADPTQLVVPCAHADVQEISAKFARYVLAYEYEEQLLREAFIMAQNIYAATKLRHEPLAPRHKAPQHQSPMSPADNAMPDMETTHEQRILDSMPDTEAPEPEPVGEQTEHPFVRARRVEWVASAMPYRAAHLAIGDDEILPVSVMP